MLYVCDTVIQHMASGIHTVMRYTLHMSQCYVYGYDISQLSLQVASYYSYICLTGYSGSVHNYPAIDSRKVSHITHSHYC